MKRVQPVWRLAATREVAPIRPCGAVGCASLVVTLSAKVKHQKLRRLSPKVPSAAV